MKTPKALMLNKKASNPKNKPDQILESLVLRRGQNIADIGAGGGYFSIRFSEAVGTEGKVYAVDTNSKFLEFIGDSVKGKGLSNVETILATRGRLNLPEKSLDLIFMRNVTHHIPNRVEYFRNLRGVLKPEGRIAVIDKQSGLFSIHRLFGHYIKKEIIVKEMEEAGYILEKEFDFLPEQSFTIYLKKVPIKD